MPGVIEKYIPNYEKLFGSADICECQHCRSVYSPAAYFVDILQFLKNSKENEENRSPLDILLKRRPDLAHLPLTCENTNTIIPYIDLANEVMEYYVAFHDQPEPLTDFKGYDTGNATAVELRSNPQNAMIAAYKKLNESVYPFSLPYHQPLNVIRSFLGHLGTSRYEVLTCLRNDKPAAPNVDIAISAELLNLSEDEYKILTGKKFNGTDDAKEIWEYYGYPDEAGMHTKIYQVKELLKITGITYTDLLEIVKTRFINPNQDQLEYIEDLFKGTGIPSPTLYEKLRKIKSGSLIPSADTDIMKEINLRNITSDDFKTWVENHFDKLGEVILLYSEESKCNLDITILRTLRSIYETPSENGITNMHLDRLHRFIRLWRKMGWTVHELDNMITASGKTDITPALILTFSWIKKINERLRLPLNQLSCLWGNIDDYGNKSLYEKLFLDKSAQKINDVFKADKYGNYLADNTKTMGNYIPDLLAAFKLTSDQFNTIIADAGLDLNTAVINIENLSLIYRYVILSKSLNLSIAEICLAKSIFPIRPFTYFEPSTQKFVKSNPEDAWSFLETIDEIKVSGFKIQTLYYIFGSKQDPRNKVMSAKEEQILDTIGRIRNDFKQIEFDHPDSEGQKGDQELLRRKLALIYPGEVIEQLLATLNDKIVFGVNTVKNFPIVIPDSLNKKIKYLKETGRLQCTGVMTSNEKTMLENLASSSPDFKNAIGKIYNAPEDLLKNNFESIYNGKINDAIRDLFDRPVQPQKLSPEQKKQRIFKDYLPFLKRILRRNIIVRHISILIGIDEPSTIALLGEKLLMELADLLSQYGITGTYYKNDSFTEDPNEEDLELTDNKIDFDWKLGAPGTTIPADKFSVRWEGFLCPPSSGDYALIVEIAGKDESVSLFLDGELTAIKKTAGSDGLMLNTSHNLTAGRMYRMKVEYTDTTDNAGIRLYWRTDSMPQEIIPSQYIFPIKTFKSLSQIIEDCHRAAQFINGFNLIRNEIFYFKENKEDWKVDGSDFDFFSLKPGDWKRIFNYTALKAAASSQAELSNLFRKAKNPSTEFDDLINEVGQYLGWAKEDLLELVKNHFYITVDAFKNEAELIRLKRVTSLAEKTGVSVKELIYWGKVVVDFDELEKIAHQTKHVLKAKYNEDVWIETAKGINNRLRENQKQALINFLLVEHKLIKWGVVDADSLFEYFLIDVQMGACMDTSRIKQAISSVQLFIARCFLNLEAFPKANEVTGEIEESGVSPEAIDADSWEWRKLYRVWEANRKVFLYPENWLEPEWRDDKSSFFKELESELLQNDITERTVEDALRAYLYKLNEVSHLEISGVFEDKDTSTLHVFGRTNAAPYQYYYRTRNKFNRWSSWEKIPMDIRSVEDGNDSGAHLLPIVWKKRLFLFWPEFFEKQEKQSEENQSALEASKINMSELEAKRYWEVKLAWSEYRENKWSPKQLSKEYIIPGALGFRPEVTPKKVVSGNFGQTQILGKASSFSALDKVVAFAALEHNKAEFVEKLKTYTFNTTIQDGALKISLSLEGKNNVQGTFTLYDIQSKIDVSYENKSMMTATSFSPVKSSYASSFMAFEKNGKLNLKGNNYFDVSQPHQVIYSHESSDLENSLSQPFFYQDRQRTYFSQPVDISYYIQTIKEPEKSFFLPLTKLKDITSVSSNLLKTSNPAPITRAASTVASITDLTAISGADFRSFHTLASNKPAAASVAALPSLGKKSSFYISDSIKTKPAFGGKSLVAEISKYKAFELKKIADKGLKFSTFFHPYASHFTSFLNQGGISQIENADISLPDDSGTFFEKNYRPNITNGLVQKPFPKINVDFDEYGAYSIYNWELFFHIPLFIATRLSKNGKYAESMRWFHYIFDPTTNEKPDSANPNARFWKVLPFKTTSSETIEDLLKNLQTNKDPGKKADLQNKISEWLENPFKPHLIARGRPSSYMKNVVIKYVENCRAWGDDLFRRDTIEYINEATQLYVLAAHMAPKSQFVPKRGKIKPECYDSMKDRLDDFSNALVQLENVFPSGSDEAPVTGTAYSGSLLGAGSSLYFCIPNNDRLMKHWDEVADRLFKIRHCMNIEGVERKLALFEPPIDPGLLVAAAAKGLSIGSILSDMNSPAPIYRYTYLSQKATEFCAEVKALGSAMLSALVNIDVEKLTRVRAEHENKLLEMITAVKDRQVLEATANKQALEKSRESAKKRMQYNLDLLGISEFSIPDGGKISLDLTSDTALPADTLIQEIQPDVDVSLLDADEQGVKLIGKEKEELDKNSEAQDFLASANIAKALPVIFHVVPEFGLCAMPFGIGGRIVTGGPHWARAASEAAEILQWIGGIKSSQAGKASKMSTYIRREQEWVRQANLASKEIIQIDKQITAAEIRIQIASKELNNHNKQVEHAKEVEQFLKYKFTNKELYQWMKEQLFSTYKQSYQLAYDLAKKAEKAYRFEIGRDDTNFIQYGYWDSSYEGLMAGEKLHLAIRQMENAFMEENKREYELTKHISLAMLDPYALMQLKHTGSCEINIPEEIFDLDYPGHYFRRIKSVSLTVPCIVGPYTPVNCTLRLLKNSIRTKLIGENGELQYQHNNDEGVLVDDTRFRDNNIPFKSMATSSGQNDSGIFELNFRDERYLPFEGAGVISNWKVELNGKYNDEEKNKIIDISQFDCNSISDIIIQLKYTAREDAGKFRKDVYTYMEQYVKKKFENEERPFVRLISLKHDFPNEYFQLMEVTRNPQKTEIEITRERFPYLFSNKKVKIMKTQVFLKPKKTPGTITAPSGLKIGDSEFTAFTDIFDNKLKWSMAADQPEFDAFEKKLKIEAAGNGLRKEEIDDMLILVDYRVE